MGKIFNTFKYGSGKTKLVLLLTILAGIGTVALFVASFIIGEMLLFFGGVICAFVTISLAQTFAISGETLPEVKPVMDSAIGNIINNMEYTDKPVEETQVIEKPEEHTHSIPEEKVEVTETYIKEDYVASDNHEEKNIGAFEEEQDDAYSEAMTILEGLETGETFHKEEEVPVDEEEKTSKAKTKKKKLKKEKKEKEPKPAKEKKKKELSEKKLKEKEPKEETKEEITKEEVIESYNKKKIKKVMHTYKVIRNHRMVLVDHCTKLDIHQAPAYIWIADKEINLLLIEKEPRLLTLPIFSVTDINYLKKQPANPDIDYTHLKGNSLLANLFKPYLPDYAHSTVVDDLTAYKNLYGIGPGIYFTNNSAANLFSLLAVNFNVKDKVTLSNKVNAYFKEAYKANILLRDNVIDANGYADKISKTLDDMAHSTISYNEFKETLNLLIKNKLITQEFAMYYMDVRDKISR